MNILTTSIVLLSSAAFLQAKTVTVSFEAKIRETPVGTRFEEKLKAGTLITGKFSFDPGTKNTYDGVEFGEYHFKGPKCGMIVNLANIPLESAPNKPFYIWNSNDNGSWDGIPGTDFYTVAAQEILCPDPGFAAQTMYIQGTDGSAKAISSNDLLPGFPEPKAFDSCELHISGEVYVIATVTKITTDDSLFIPVVSILPASGDFLQTQSIDPVIRIGNVKPEDVRIGKILLDDVDVTKRYLETSRIGALAGDQSAAVWQLTSPQPSPGLHVFKVKVITKSGSSTWAEVHWNILEAKLGKGQGRVSERRIPGKPRQP